MGRKVRKKLNIDAAKLKRAREHLGLDTETKVIDRLLDDCNFERDLLALLKEAPPSLRNFRRSAAIFRCTFGVGGLFGLFVC